MSMDSIMGTDMDTRREKMGFVFINILFSCMISSKLLSLLLKERRHRKRRRAIKKAICLFEF